ncbi:MAG: hypothetical protein M3Q42_11455 [Pseudomonadota bacterium]|nr:hypothetical protein [Pseudomonadota bacterium]
MNNSLRRLAIPLAFVLVAPAFAQAPAKKLYCWEEGGRKICGDSLPASAVNNARTEISAKSGLASGRVARALSAEERAAAAAEADAEKTDAAEAAAAARRDMAMVESYADEAELQRAFQHRLTLLEETVKASVFGVTGMRQSLVSLLSRAGDRELSGKPVPQPLAESIQAQHQALRRQEALLVQQQIELGEVDQELDAALERYRALKKPAAPSS